MKFDPFEKAREFARSLKFTKISQWRDYCNSGARPKNIPSNPDKAYPSQWISMADWLGYPSIHNRRTRTKEMFIEQRAFVHSLKLQTIFEYRDWKRSPDGRAYPDLPLNADVVYRDFGWSGWGDWVGTGNVALFNREYLPFVEAREIVHAQRFQNTTQLRKWKNRPVNVPSHPQKQYPNEFVSMSDGLAALCGSPLIPPGLLSKQESLFDQKKLHHIQSGRNFKQLYGIRFFGHQ